MRKIKRGFVALDPDTHNTVALLARMRKCNIGVVVRLAVLASMSDFEKKVIEDMMKQADYADEMASQRMPQ
jgi:hypothetical protein